MANVKQIVNVPELFDSRPRGFVQCITVGNLVFVAGQGGVDTQVKLVSPEFAPQARQALLNVRRALEAAGVRPVDVVVETVYLTDIGNIREFGAIKQDVLGETLATSTTVEVSKLALPGMLVEVTVMAVRLES